MRSRAFISAARFLEKDATRYGLRNFILRLLDEKSYEKEELRHRVEAILGLTAARFTDQALASCRSKGIITLVGLNYRITPLGKEVLSEVTKERRLA